MYLCQQKTDHHDEGCSRDRRLPFGHLSGVSAGTINPQIEKDSNALLQRCYKGDNDNPGPLLECPAQAHGCSIVGSETAEEHLIENTDSLNTAVLCRALLCTFYTPLKSAALYYCVVTTV